MKSILLTVFTLIMSFSGAFSRDEFSYDFKGQVSLVHASSFDQSFPNSPTTLRYIPQIRGDYQLDENRLGFDGALDLFSFSLGDSMVDGNVNLYRFTMRYDTPRTQIRLGLQKVNFGPARMLRVLQWFDKLDPRDPLALSPGVWAAMGRYYFESGANLRLWTMADAPDQRRDYYHLSDDWPWDVGGRLEYPIPAGTLALTLHALSVLPQDAIREQRAALDLRVDAVVGLWTEVMLSHSEQLILKDVVNGMVGIDYTFGIGNGLYLALESFTSHFGNVGEEMPWIARSTAIMGTYTLGLSDGLTAYLYAINYPDTESQYMPMIGWQHTRGNWLYYLAIYDSPELEGAATMGMPSGTGVQLNIAFNH